MKPMTYLDACGFEASLDLISGEGPKFSCGFCMTTWCCRLSDETIRRHMKACVVEFWKRNKSKNLRKR